MMLKTESGTRPAYHQLPDPDIVCLCREGQTEAFNVLINRYEERVLKLAWRYLRDHDQAADETQEIFIKVFRKLGLFRGEASFKTWLYRVAINHCLNASKRRRVAAKAMPVYFSLDQAQETGLHARPTDSRVVLPEDACARQELVHTVQAVIDRLPCAQRQAMILRHYENLTYAEIAAVMRIPVSRLRACLYRARRKLKRLLEAADGPCLIWS